MKVKPFLILGLLIATLLYSPINLQAQEEESGSPFSLGADLVSSYVWRGSKSGTGPNIQPYIEFSKGGFTLGAWGTTSFHDLGDIPEVDLYASYAFDCGLSFGITDYYFQGTPFFRYSTDSASHAFEGNLEYKIERLTFSANYVFNDASNGGPGNKPGGGDMYFELGYDFKYFGVFAGAGNGWTTTYKDNGDDVFALCNLGIKTSKEIKITDKYSIPVSGMLNINPDREELNLVIGISF